MLTSDSSSSEEGTRKRRIRTLVAAGAAVTCGGIAILLGTHPDIEVVATTESESDMLCAAVQQRPDVLLLEHSILHDSEFLAAKRFRRFLPDVCVIVFMDTKGALDEARCREAGADACVTREQVPEGLVSEIRKSFSHRPPDGPMRMKKGA